MKNITLSEEMTAKLSALAAQNNESLQEAVNHALSEYFSQQEMEAIRWKEAREADSSIERGQGIAGTKILAWLESWGKSDELPSP
jgi:predicted transcriptional regulator